MRNGALSFWLSQQHLDIPTTTALGADDAVDIAIVGGGLTGLWTAWALAHSDPSLSIAVYEAESLGFGASGRNGGWLSAKSVGLRRVLQHHGTGREGVIEVERLIEEAMHNVVDILGADNIDAAYGGWLQVARSRPELRRLEAAIAASRAWGVGDDRLSLLSAEQAHNRIAVDGVTGALYSPHNYRVNPAKMLFTLAKAVLRMGVRIHTGSPVQSIGSGTVDVNGHRVTVARRTVVATEGYSARQPGQRRKMLPLNSSMLVTEPLHAAQWDRIGWEQCEGLAGAAHTYFYGQRTPDGRIAIGGRGKPYRFRSGLDHRGELDTHAIRALTMVLQQLFPEEELHAAHAWCGVLGVTRDWSPFVEEGHDGRVIRAGGFAGQGLAASHLMGRIVAALIGDPGSDLTRLPWVRRNPRNWELEPLRWIGANGLYRAYAVADWLESRSKSDKTSRVALVADQIAGR